MSQPSSSSERAQAATDCLTRYLRLCDVPAPVSPDAVAGELAGLFTEDAVWAGAGTEFAREFGTTHGRDAIVEMLGRYLPPHPHFTANTHLLFPGAVETGDSSVRGVWPMQQLSRYADGTGEIRVARLTVDFQVGPELRMSSFRTERLFSSPLCSAPSAP